MTENREEMQTFRPLLGDFRHLWTTSKPASNKWTFATIRWTVASNEWTFTSK